MVRVSPNPFDSQLESEERVMKRELLELMIECLAIVHTIIKYALERR
jgi:hypothetical protein